MPADTFEERVHKQYEAAFASMMSHDPAAIKAETRERDETNKKRRPLRLRVANIVLLAYTPVVCGLLLLSGTPLLQIGMVALCLAALLCIGALQPL